MSKDYANAMEIDQPNRYLRRMLLFLVAVGGIGFLLAAPLERAFQANLAFNSLIAAVLLVGVIHSFREIISLRPEIKWVNSFRKTDPGLVLPSTPVLLAPMATMLGERSGPVTLNTLSMRSILDSISSRLEESRDMSRYMIGLLIFLGLLGTFWGLLGTVTSVGDTIGSLSAPNEGEDGTAVFTALQEGLTAPLAGMGTAFSSSLFGLGGSLILGFLDLQAGQAQNRFYNDLEEWLSTVTRLSAGPAGMDADQSAPGYISALLEQTADNMSSLQLAVEKSVEDRNNANAHLMELTEKLATLTDMMRTEQQLLMKVAEGQVELKPVLERLSTQKHNGSGFDDVTSGHIRNIDVSLKHMLEEVADGREQVLRDLKNEIKVLTKTVANLNGRQNTGG